MAVEPEARRRAHEWLEEVYAKTPEREALRDTVRQFVKRDVAPYLDAWERAGELPRELHRKAGEAGEGGDRIRLTTRCDLNYAFVSRHRRRRLHRLPSF